MIPYLTVFCLVAIIAFADVIRIKHSQRLLLLLFASVLLSLFAGLRYDLPDYMPYWEGFKEVSRSGLVYSDLDIAAFFEPGYNLLAWIISRILDHPVALFVIVASLAVGLNLAFYKRYSHYFLIAVLLYFSHTFLMRETMQIRAGVAAAIVLWSLPYVEKHKPWRFIAIVVLAMGFHLASGVFLLVYLVYHWNWTAKTWKWIVAICLIMGLALPFGKLLTMLPSGGIFGRILAYSWMVEQGPSGVLTNPTIIKQLFIVIICLKYWDILIERAPHFRLLVTPLLISVCWLMVWNDFAIVAGRMGTFFSVTEVLVYPMLMYLVTPRSRPVMGILLVLFALSTLSLNLWVGNIMPYHFICISE